MKTIIYLHGFGSSGNSQKVELLKKQFPESQIISPNLKLHPREVLNQLDELLKDEDLDDVVLVGTSLGGFYAHYMSIHWDYYCLLINPAIFPSVSTKRYLGTNINYSTAEKFEWIQEYIDSFKELESERKEIDEDKDIITVVLGTNDEILDFKKTKEFFEFSRVFEFDENHRFSNISKVFGNKEIMKIFEERR